MENLISPITQEDLIVKGVKFSVVATVLGQEMEVGRASLYRIPNQLHQKPFGFLEDVYVDASQRGKGIGTQLVHKVIEEASTDCYKLICTSRHEKPAVHRLYEGLGFKNHGLEFRIDFP
jgi:GNAT superfamily N-acetyltransferase